MGKFKGMNQKAAAAAEKKASNQNAKDASMAAEREKQAQAEWSKGANTRAKNRSEEAAAKADEAARKRREKAALLAEEEEAMGSGGKPKKTPTLSKKGKGKKKNDFSMLEDALIGAADKKVKAKRQSEKLKQERIKAEQAKKKEKEKPLDPLMANTQNMLVGTEDNLVGRAANKALESENVGSGMDGALDSLSISTGPASLPSAKALFKAFEERMMPQVKEDYPNLKLSQYKDKIFQMWKKSSENPANQAS